MVVEDILLPCCNRKSREGLTRKHSLHTITALTTYTILQVWESTELFFFLQNCDVQESESISL